MRLGEATPPPLGQPWPSFLYLLLSFPFSSYDLHAPIPHAQALSASEHWPSLVDEPQTIL
eukprot:4477800-Karenia_brevis.AAC.1